jgi:hypothetical protein
VAQPVPCQNPACRPDLLLGARRSCSYALTYLVMVRVLGWLMILARGAAANATASAASLMGTDMPFYLHGRDFGKHTCQPSGTQPGAGSCSLG